MHDFDNRAYQGSVAAVKKFSEEQGIPYFCLADECGSAVLLK